MTKIIIVDYSLKIVITIIIYNLHCYHCLKQPRAVFLDENKHSIVLSLKCELYIELVSSLNKKVQICMVL